jgi:hypothetical protein
MAPKAITSFVGSKVLQAAVRKKLADISTNPDRSSHRGRDEERKDELKIEFSNGNYGLNIFARPAILADASAKESANPCFFKCVRPSSAYICNCCYLFHQRLKCNVCQQS